MLYPFHDFVQYEKHGNAPDPPTIYKLVNTENQDNAQLHTESQQFQWLIHSDRNIQDAE